MAMREIRLLPLLDRYILLEYLLSFFVCFLFYFLIFFLNQILLMAQDILAKGIPIGSVLLLMLYSLPSFVTLSVPFGTLTSAMMTYGRFSSDNEILAMRGAGFRRIHIFRSVLISGILLAVLSFSINDVLLPAGTRAFRRLWLELSLTHPGLELEAYAVRRYKDSILVTGAIDEEGIHPMVIIERENSGNRSSIVSRLASPEIRGRQDELPGFRMHDVMSLTPNSKDRNEYTWSGADYMDYRLLAGDSSILDRQLEPAHMKAREVRQTIIEKSEEHSKRLQVHNERLEGVRWAMALEYAELTGGDEFPRNVIPKIDSKAAEITEILASVPRNHSLQVWKLEYYQKFALPFACIPFVLLAFPLGLSAKRSGRAVGFFIGLLLTSVYWSLFVLGRSLGLRTDISPFIAMIVPDLLLLAIGLVLYFRRRVR